MNYDESEILWTGDPSCKRRRKLFFELLLRKEDNKNIFPKDSYLSMISQQEEHQQYVKWLQNIDPNLEANPTKRFSFNLDPQELEYEETFDLLENLKEYKQRLIIEITEKPPNEEKLPLFFRSQRGGLQEKSLSMATKSH